MGNIMNQKKPKVLKKAKQSMHQVAYIRDLKSRYNETKNFQNILMNNKIVEEN